MTTMLKWSPFQDLDSVERRMRRMFEEVGFAPTLLPAADIYETEDEFVVEVEVPGYEENELGIEVSDHQLTIKGERKETKEKTEKSFRLHERLEREFERRFQLPAEADTSTSRRSSPRASSKCTHRSSPPPSRTRSRSRRRETDDRGGGFSRHPGQVEQGGSDDNDQGRGIRVFGTQARGCHRRF